MKEALDVHFRLALSEFGAYCSGEELYERMYEIWKEYEEFGVPEP